MLEITGKTAFRNFRKGWKADLTRALEQHHRVLLVGDNGTGKSTVLQALRGYKDNNPQKINLKLEDLPRKVLPNFTVATNYDEIYHLDSVMDDGNSMMNAYDAVSYMKSGGHAANTISRGQGSLFYLDRFIQSLPTAGGGRRLVVLDEVDTGLSLLLQRHFLKVLDKLNNLGYDVVCYAQRICNWDVPGGVCNGSGGFCTGE